MIGRVGRWLTLELLEVEVKSGCSIELLVVEPRAESCEECLPELDIPAKVML